MADDNQIPDDIAPEGVDWQAGIPRVKRDLNVTGSLGDVIDESCKELRKDVIRHVEECARYDKFTPMRARTSLEAPDGTRIMVVLYFVPPGSSDPVIEDEMPTGEVILGEN